MKNTIKRFLVVAVMVMIAFSACDEKEDEGYTWNDNGIYGYLSVTADGSATQKTLKLTLTFNQAIPGLSAADITLSGVEGVIKGTLSAPETMASYYNYTLPISGFTAGGDLTVAVTKSDYINNSSTVKIYYVDVKKMDMVTIPAGTFTMGSPASEQNSKDNERPQHQVTLSEFKMCKYEVTQAQWLAVMDINPLNPYLSSGKGDNYPIYGINWYAVIVFCNKLSMKEGLEPVYKIGGYTDPAEWGSIPTSGNDSKWNAVAMDKSKNGYRLPTEAEWEYACRAKTTTAYNTGEDISDKTGWYSSNSDGSVHEVGLKPANAWGLYDMHGNVSEWCWDDGYGAYSSEPQTDPPDGASSSGAHAYRGGGAGSPAWDLRSAARNSSGGSNGFRLVVRSK